MSKTITTTTNYGINSMTICTSLYELHW